MVTTATDYIQPFIAWLDLIVDGINESEDAGEIIATLKVLKEMVAQTREAAAQIEARYVEIAPRKAEYPSIGVVEVKRSTSRTQWQHDEVLKRVVAAARDERLFDEESGEALEDEYVTLARVLGETARFEWRLLPLRARGIEPDDFCAVDYGKGSVKM